ncbi:MAG: AraC family transcriptional regulator [Treponemataceae bacterium]|nr:AraC family transcriptional regulator [Treponemataceae bacterium]
MLYNFIMQMSDIPEELLKESYDETLYKEYFDAKKNPALLKQFLVKLNPVDLIEKTLFIPDFPETTPDILPEEWFFGSNRRKNIVIRKHPDYTPVFYHCHEFLELFYVLEGQTKQVINGMEFHMKKGDICLIPPNVKHSISVFDSSIILNILIRQTTFEDIFSNFLRTENILSSFFLSNMYSTKAADYIIFHTDLQDGQKTGGADNIETIRSLVLGMYKETTDTDSFSQDMLQADLHRLFIFLVRKFSSSYDLPPDVNKNTMLRFDIIRYIQENRFDISLDKIAGAFNFSPQYASKLIKQLTGRNFTDIVLHMRMEHACSLLSDTKIPVGDIAIQTGYINPEHFIRTFKKKYGVTPGEYRHNTISKNSEV